MISVNPTPDLARASTPGRRANAAVATIFNLSTLTCARGEINVGRRVGSSEGVGVGEGVRSDGAIEGSEGGLVGIKLGLGEAAEGAKVGSREG
jgi:hypothetical protein